MDARGMLSRGVETGLRLGRGTADRVVTIAGPRLGRLADKVASKVRRPQPPTTSTFTPSKKTEPHRPEERASGGDEGTASRARLDFRDEGVFLHGSHCRLVMRGLRTTVVRDDVANLRRLSA